MQRTQTIETIYWIDKMTSKRNFENENLRQTEKLKLAENE